MAARFSISTLAAPEWARAGAEEALRSTDDSHYAPTKRRTRPQNAIRDFYGAQFGKELDPETEIVVTSGGERRCVAFALALPYSVLFPYALPVVHAMAAFWV